jgi:thiamine biosynthesis lipoprotein
MKENMQLDLGGIAKGYAASAMLAALRRQGLHRALVAVSGDLAIGDPPPGAEGWSVATSGGTLMLARCAISSSGAESQYLEWNGKQLSHIIDPRSGNAVPARPPVTVIAKDAAEADALATALYILEAGERTRLLSRYPKARMLPPTPRAYRSSTR